MVSILCWPSVPKHMACPGLWFTYSFTLLKKIDFPSTRQKLVERCDFVPTSLSLCCDFVWFEFVQVLCTLSRSQWVPLGFKHQRIWKMLFFFLSYQPPLALKLFLPAVPQGSQSLELEGFSEDNPFTSESFAFFMLFICDNYRWLQQESSLVRIQWCTNTRLQKYVFSGCFIAMLTLQKNCSRFPIGHDLSSVRLLAPLTRSCMHVISWNGP